MSRTDKESIRLCLDGHPEAFKQLVVRHQAPLLSYLTGRLGDAEGAEEAAQEAFVRSYFCLNKLRKPESFSSWLFGIAHRVVKEQRRDAARRRNVARMMSSEKPKDGASAQDVDLERAVAGLSGPYREVILLRYYGKMSCAEVAENLGIPLGTVTKRLSRAHVMLRKSLDQSGRAQERTEVER